MGKGHSPLQPWVANHSGLRQIKKCIFKVIHNIWSGEKPFSTPAMGSQSQRSTPDQKVLERRAKDRARKAAAVASRTSEEAAEAREKAKLYKAAQRADAAVSLTPEALSQARDTATQQRAALRKRKKMSSSQSSSDTSVAATPTLSQNPVAIKKRDQRARKKLAALNKVSIMNVRF